MINKPRKNGSMPLVPSLALQASRWMGGLSVAGAALLSSTVAYAQSTADGSIYGSVSGGDLAGLTVTAVSSATGVTRASSVDGSGGYRLAQLTAGSYTVTLRRGAEVLQTREDVFVSAGVASTLRFSLSGDVVALEKFVVTGGSISPIDVTRTESVTILSEQTLDTIPVARNVTAVALLAPGTLEGDSGFGNLASFGGASVAENTFYINGFNVTNFRNGLGGSSVPFEFYKAFQIKTGGYGAEFGRSTGGVVDATTKSGSNEMHVGFSSFLENNALSDTAPNVYLPSGAIYNDNSRDYSQTLNVNGYVSFPVIKDHLFVYGIYNKRDINSEFLGSSGTTDYEDSSTSPFWGVKIDAVITSDHSFEITSFSDKRETLRKAWDFDYSTKTRGDYVGDTIFKRGGRNDIIRYKGTITEDLSLSALWGRGKYDLTDAGAGDAFPYILDTRVNPSGILLGNATQLAPSEAADERTAMRFDGSYQLGSHLIRFGYDSEDNKSNDLTGYSGGGTYWRYYTRAPGSALAGGVVPAGVTQVVRERFYQVGGSFGVENQAYYLEDNWRLLNKKLLITAGVRNETFKNRNKNDDVFVEIDDQIAPRVGALYDFSGDGRSKLFANYGRYHLPVASNTNVRMAGGELFTEKWFALNGLNADSTPVKGAQIGSTTVYSDGTVQDPRTQVNLNMDPMYQDEYILGYQFALNKDWSVGVKGIYRDLKSAMDDVIVNDALAAFAARNKITFVDPGTEVYILTNPGKPISMYWDLDDNGSLEKVELTSADLGFPEAKRTYYAVEFSVEKVWSNNWFFQGSYTWSQSYGNTEGYVNSDLDQDDAGITANFDTPALTVNTDGFLPNDRRHSIKLFGGYKLSKEITLGSSLRSTSGRPINVLGNNPDGSAGYAGDFLLVSRGGGGRTDWSHQWDMSLTYKPSFLQDKVTFGIDVFNVLNLHEVVETFETKVDASGAAESRYGIPTRFQTPRYVRLSTSIDF